MRRTAALGTLALLAGRPAAAIDSVTRTYTGRMTCRQIAGGAWAAPSTPTS